MLHRIAVSAALGAILLAGPALAQTAREPGGTGGTAPRTTEPAPPSPGAPIDRGPDTPDANRAHRGGGVVLEGAPGAPAPAPQPTPPGPSPRDTPPAR